MAKKATTKKAPVKKAAPVKKKQGVKPGSKRGGYNKSKISKIYLQQNEISKNEIAKDLLNAPIDSAIIENENIDTIHETKFNNFLNDNGTDFNESDYEEPENLQPDQDIKPEILEPENKEFDFTQAQDQDKGDVNLNALKDSQKVLINGMLLLSICDMVLPALIKFIYKNIDINAKKVNLSNTKLDQDQRESLKDVADYASAYIFEKVNPMIIFFIGMGAMYYTNFTGELSKIEKTKKPDLKKNDFSSLTDLLINENETPLKNKILNPKNKK